MDIKIISQIFCLIAALCINISSWQKKKSKLYFFLLLNNIFYFLAFFIIKAYSGAFSNIIGIFRLFMFEKYYNKDNRKVLYFIMGLYIIMGIVTFQNIFSIMPIMSCLVHSTALWNKVPKNIRKGTAVMIFIWCTYDIILGLYFSALIEFISFISTCIAIYKLDFKSKKLI